MTKFVVRVQFIAENQKKYTILRDALLKIGFTKRIKDKQGIEYRLPNGNYYVETASPKEDVIKAVKNIAFQIEKSPMILVVPVGPEGMTWINLERC